MNAIVAMLATDPIFPPAELDEPEPSNFVAADINAPGVGHVLSVTDGASTTTRDGGRDDDFEIDLEVQVGYAVQSTVRADRRRVRDSGSSRIEALVAANRTLGMTFPTYVEIRDVSRDDNVYTADGPPVATLIMTLVVSYVATSAAG